MKRLEVKLYIDFEDDNIIDAYGTKADDIVFHLDTGIDDIIGGTVKRVDLIDEKEI